VRRGSRAGQLAAYLPLLDLEAKCLDLLLQPALPLFALLDVLLELRLQLLARGLELLQLDLQRLVLGLVVCELFLGAAPLASRRRGRTIGHGEAAAAQAQAQVSLGGVRPGTREGYMFWWWAEAWVRCAAEAAVELVAGERRSFLPCTATGGVSRAVLGNSHAPPRDSARVLCGAHSVAVQICSEPVPVLVSS
jgi:hypothetical protein